MSPGNCSKDTKTSIVDPSKPKILGHSSQNYFTIFYQQDIYSNKGNPSFIVIFTANTVIIKRKSPGHTFSIARPEMRIGKNYIILFAYSLITNLLKKTNQTRFL